MPLKLTAAFNGPVKRPTHQVSGRVFRLRVAFVPQTAISCLDYLWRIIWGSLFFFRERSGKRSVVPQVPEWSVFN